MKSLNQINRKRRLLLKSMAAYAIAGASQTWANERCDLTPPQPEGPFYPFRWPDQNRTDLTFAGKALGEIIILKGQLRDADCTPAKNALVELWQANHHGRYRHSRDNRNRAPLDPSFYGLGRVKTDHNGLFEFKTIIPGSYAAGPGWQRPPHLHFKVWHRNNVKFITQMYFADEPLNQSDLILNQIPENERHRVIVPFRETKGIKKGTFKLHIPA